MFVFFHNLITNKDKGTDNNPNNPQLSKKCTKIDVVNTPTVNDIVNGFNNICFNTFIFLVYMLIQKQPRIKLYI